MAIVIQCPNCGKKYRLNDEMAGKQAKCNCGNVLSIPAHSSPEQGSHLLDLLEQQPVPSNTPPPGQQAGGFVPPGGASFGVPAAHPSQADSNRVLWITAGCIGALLALSVVVLVAVWVASPSDQSPSSSADNSAGSASAPASDGAAKPVAKGNDVPMTQSLPEFAQVNDVYSISMSPDGSLLAIGAGDKTDDVWDVPNDRMIAAVPNERRYDLALSRDGRLLGKLIVGNIVTCWEFPSMKEKFRVKVTGRGGLRPFGFCGNDSVLVCLMSQGLVRIDPQDGTLRHLLFKDFRVSQTAAYSPVDKIAAVGALFPSEKAGLVQIHELDAGEVKKTLDVPNTPDTLVFSRDGKMLVAAMLKGAVIAWNTADWTKRASTMGGGTHGYSHVAISPDGNTVAVLPSRTGRPAPEIWNLQTNQIRKVEGQWWTDVAFLPDGTLMGVSRRRLVFFDPLTGKPTTPKLGPQ